MTGPTQSRSLSRPRRHLFEHRTHEEMCHPAAEKELMDILREWRAGHVREYLVEHDFVSTFVLDTEDT
jgi:hypothetical protein